MNVLALVLGGFAGFAAGFVCVPPCSVQRGSNRRRVCGSRRGIVRRDVWDVLAAITVALIGLAV